MQEMLINGEAKNWSHILDLGCGDGRLGRSAAGAYRFAHGSSVAEPYIEGVEENLERAQQATALGMDYVHCKRLDEMRQPAISIQTLVIANPPFSQFEEFLDYAMKLADRNLNTSVMFLLRLNALGAQKRYDFWRGHRRPALRVLSQRPSFTGDGHTDSTEYAWYLWRRGGVEWGDNWPALNWYAPQG